MSVGDHLQAAHLFEPRHPRPPWCRLERFARLNLACTNLNLLPRGGRVAPDNDLATFHSWRTCRNLAVEDVGVRLAARLLPEVSGPSSRPVLFGNHPGKDMFEIL